MAEHNTKEELNVKGNSILETDVMTGDKDYSRFLYYQLKMCMKKAEKIDIIVSFLMESGVKMILEDLKGAVERGVKIRILTGNYLGITQPAALYLLKKELGNSLDLRFYNEKGRSFHPKSYLFHYDNYSEIFIGSSNISRSALTSGIEWNYRFNNQSDKENFDLFFDVFKSLFENHSIIIDDKELKRYSKSWKKPAVFRDLSLYDESEEKEIKVEKIIQPRGIQIEALYALQDTREEGAGKALVQAATGAGKTYLAAFDSKDYEKVLFVAHREEILKQAALSFENVRKSKDFGFFNGQKKSNEFSVVFASVSTLGKEMYLNEKYFEKDYFDYIIIDEFHHAASDQYKRIVKYFQPKFMLGLTATPERMDGKDIYELCDYNVPYELSLKDAINKGVLVPFHYYGIYDNTDYSNFRQVKGKYDEKDLNKVYVGNKVRNELIYKYYMKYGSKRALGFCCSRKHAEEMARDFCARGIKSVAVYSNSDGEFSEERNEAIRKLKSGEIKAVFSVDMFNEGVDIKNVDMVMFLRPTESPVVFLQQLGRGLRSYKDKEYLNVLDFIGNYEKAGKTPLLLSGQNSFLEKSTNINQDLEFPKECIVDFDMRLVDLFKEMSKRSASIKELIKVEYFRVKELVEKVPSRIELFTYMEDEIYLLCIKNSKENPFKRYLSFLNELNELSVGEAKIYNSIGREFLSLIETTDMQKVYKMPVLMCFYNNGKIKTQIKDEEVLKTWKDFFEKDTNWRDLSEGLTYEKFKNISDKEHLSNIKRNPVKYLISSGKDFFIEKEGYTLAIRDEVEGFVKDEDFINHFEDIIEYRIMEYYRKRYLGKNI